MRVIASRDLIAELGNAGIEPVSLLGAGCSVMSGLPTSAEIVRLVMRWQVAAQNSWDPSDMRIRGSDVQQALERQPWYRPNEELGTFFSDAMRLIDQPRARRRDFLLTLIQHATSPSRGYLALAKLLRRGLISTVLTPNFDDCLGTAYGAGVLIRIAKRDEYSSLSTAPRYPQLVYLHGQAEYYMDRNLSEEVEHLDPDLVTRLGPLLRDHPLVVVGYRGAEPSIMKDLFCDRADDAGSFRQGIYWCVRNTGSDANLHPMVQQLAQAIGQNFILVENTTFDSLLTEWSAAWEAAPPKHSRSGSAQSIGQGDNEGPLDLRPTTMAAEHLADNFANDPNLRLYLTNMQTTYPDDASQEWREEKLMDIGLATRTNGKLVLTTAGALLFGNQPRFASRGAWTQIQLPGKPPRALTARYGSSKNSR